MVELKIENVVAGMDFESELNLAKIAESVQDAEYEPDRFPGAIYKLKSPKTLTLMFSKGFTVCTGAKSIQNAKAALTIIFKKLLDLKLITLEKIPKINIQDIIVSYKFKEPLELKKIYHSLPDGEKTYDPKKFPGLVYKDKTTDISVLMFRTGVIVGYGSPHIMDIQDLLESLEQYYS